MATAKLTSKQKKFCEEYMIDFNGTRAARAAGYSEKSAYSQASENLKKPEIKSYLENLCSVQTDIIFLERHRIVKALKEIAYLAVMSGMRPCELSALKWDCVLMNLHHGGHDGYFSVRRSRAQKSKVIREFTKNKDRRMVPIATELHDTINYFKSLNGDKEFVIGGDFPCETSHWSRDLQIELKKYDTLPQVTFYQLRHSFCSYLEATGMPRRLVAAIMGHRDLSTTDRYSHVNDQTLGAGYSEWSEKQNQQNSNKVGLRVI